MDSEKVGGVPAHVFEIEIPEVDPPTPVIANMASTPFRMNTLSALRVSLQHIVRAHDGHRKHDYGTSQLDLLGLHRRREWEGYWRKSSSLWSLRITKGWGGQSGWCKKEDRGRFVKRKQGAWDIEEDPWKRR